MTLAEQIAFLVIGDNNSLFPSVKILLDDTCSDLQNCMLNLCCNTEKIHDFIKRVAANKVKVTNNAIFLDGAMPSDLLKKIVITLKQSPAFNSLPITVFALPGDKDLRHFCYENYVAAVADNSEDVKELADKVNAVLSFWINTAKLPPLVINKDESNVF